MIKLIRKQFGSVFATISSSLPSFLLAATTATATASLLARSTQLNTYIYINCSVHLPLSSRCCYFLRSWYIYFGREMAREETWRKERRRRPIYLCIYWAHVASDVYVFDWCFVVWRWACARARTSKSYFADFDYTFDSSVYVCMRFDGNHSHSHHDAHEHEVKRKRQEEIDEDDLRVCDGRTRHKQHRHTYKPHGTNTLRRYVSSGSHSAIRHEQYHSQSERGLVISMLRVVCYLSLCRQTNFY